MIVTGAAKHAAAVNNKPSSTTNFFKGCSFLTYSSTVHVFVPGLDTQTARLGIHINYPREAVSSG